MQFWRQDYFESIRELTANAAKFPGWADYFAYCTLLENGLRKDALAKLDGFISSMLITSFEERQNFVSWLYHGAWNTEWLNTFVPHPLHTRLVEPTLQEWVKREPDAVEPHCWLGTLEHLRRALELDPQGEIACTRFARCILGRINVSTHELPAGYLGDDPLEDFTDLKIVERLLPSIRNTDERVHYAKRIAEMRRKLDDYIHGKTNTR